MLADEPTPDDSEVLAGRLRWAAESLTLEFPEVSLAEAELLVFAVTRDLLSSAKVAQFVPTFAARRARQLLRDREAAGIPSPWPDLEVIVADEPPPAAEQTEIAGSRPAPAAAPLQPPAYYAVEAKRLLERAKVLRAAALSPERPPE